MNIRHKRKEKEESVSTARELFQWVAAIVAAVLIALAIDNFVIVNAQIPSGSMHIVSAIRSGLILLFSAIRMTNVSYSSKGSSDFPEKRLRSGMERSI